MILKTFIISLVLAGKLLAYMNPYENLIVDEKINVMVNYFINEDLKKLKPEKPQKEKLKDDDANLNPIKYEQYFNYIQRIKAIRESRVEEQRKIDEKYQGQLAFYNRKLKKLQSDYKKEENINPIIKKSINKALKVVYGKPQFLSVKHNKRDDEFEAKLGVVDIYKINTFVPKKVKFNILRDDIDDFIEEYKKAKINIIFEFSNSLLIYKSIIFTYKEAEYKGAFVDQKENEIKLNIKINDDIFRLEKLEKI